MRRSGIYHMVQPNGLGRLPAVKAGVRGLKSGRFVLCLVWSVLIPILCAGCGHFNEGMSARSSFEEANVLSSKGDYQASLEKYSLILRQYPETGDRALFEMGIILAHPKNQQKDYRKALECLQRLVTAYPGSGYRHDSEMLIFNISNVGLKDRTIAEQQAQIERLRQEAKGRENEVAALQQKIDSLEKRLFAYVLQNGSADRILIEKGERRMSLLSKGDVIKTYRIALGGDPVGPKVKQGDNKTPEGIYSIDSRNKDSRYHLSLHISYPNERDRKRARELGVSPGGNIMIHGIKNGFSWVGDLHAEVDWTKGCIAVTDQEIEEIARLAPNGTVVEIRP